MDELPIRTGTDDDWPAVLRLINTAFHEPSEPDDWAPFLQGVLDPARSLVAIDPSLESAPGGAPSGAPGGAVVGHAAAYQRELTVPGGVLPAAYVSMVAVAPTHRRRGVLRRLMHRQLADIAGWRSPLAVLWASEPPIYPRFGYGQATSKVTLNIDTRRVRLPGTPPATPGRVRLLPPAEARKDLQRVYESVRAARPGWASRPEPWWDFVLADPPSTRNGATEWRAAVHDGAAGVDGYAIWRAKPDRGGGGEVLVHELVATDPAGHRDLWRFLLGIDLISTVRYRYCGPEEPLLHLVDDPRRLDAKLSDGLWARIVDLPAALSGRRYAAPLDVVLSVTDPLLPSNTGHWRLTGGPERARCTRVSDPAELACDINDLAAAYLGGTPLATLAAAGRVHELRPGALTPASNGFGWAEPPVAIEGF
jgi:predicted acetyltransferase